MIQLDSKLVSRNLTHPLLQLILEPSAPGDGLRGPTTPEHHVQSENHELEYRVLQPAPDEPIAAF